MTLSAIHLDPADNVICLLRDHVRGERPVTAEGEAPALRQDVRLGHKVALCSIAVGETVVKYGAKIGRATVSIEPGDHVHLHNLVGGGL